jgi:DNA polymerase-3 subunit beta
MTMEQDAEAPADAVAVVDAKPAPEPLRATFSLYQLARVMPALKLARYKRGYRPTVLDMVLIRASGGADDGRVTLTTTSLALLYEQTLAADVHVEGGVCLSFDSLAAAVKSRKKNAIEIRGDKLAYGATEATAKSYPEHDFPNTAPQGTVRGVGVVNALELHALLDKTLYAMLEDDDQRLHFCGATIAREDGVLRCVTSDGHRLALAQMPSTGDAFSVFVTAPCARLLAEVTKKCPDAVTIRRTEVMTTDDSAVRDSFLHLLCSASDNIDEWRVTMREPDANAQDYRDVIPTTHTRVARVERKALLAALAELPKTDGVVLRWEATSLTIGVYDPRSDIDMRARVPACLGGEPLVHGLNARFLREALNHVDAAEVVIEMSDPLKPITLHGGDRAHGVHVIMPMRV